VLHEGGYPPVKGKCNGSTFNTGLSTSSLAHPGQRLRTFLLVILIGALICRDVFIYLRQAAVTGLNIQNDEDYRDVLLREISTMSIQLGQLNSVASMEDRATKAGYKPVAPDKGMYVMVPGYFGRPQVNLAPPPGARHAPQRPDQTGIYPILVGISLPDRQWSSVKPGRSAAMNSSHSRL